MEDVSATTFKSRVKNVKRRLSGKDSYNPDINTPRFKVKALCWEGVSVDAFGMEASNDAVDHILSSVGSLKSKNEVVLKISIRDGVQVLSKKKTPLYAYPIHQVGYCNVDKRYPQMFVFIVGETGQQDLKCHAFLCDDFMKSRAICLTMAKAFQASYDNWKTQQAMNEQQLKLAAARRQSEDVLSKQCLKMQLDRRASEFVPSQQRRGSVESDSMHSSSSSESSIDQMSIDNSSWAKFDSDEDSSELLRKMQGDLILWE